MKLKRKLRRFFTLTRTADGGFTLIELIVVIAIMAILAGVGTAGYAGYIKAANKGADKKLVGDIMRAIETGTNSYAFVSDDSFKMGSISYPVGFIALSTDGSSVVTSSTEMTEGIEAGSCEFVPIEGVLIEHYSTKTSGCYNDQSGEYVSSIGTETLFYCATHSPAPEIVDATGTYISDYQHSGTNKSFILKKWCEGHKWEPVNTPYPSGSKRISNQNALFTEKSNGFCTYAYANQNATFTGNTNVGATTEGPIVNALKAAFGNSDSLKLKYDGWKSDDGVGYATFYNAAPQLMDDIESLSGLLVVGANLGGSSALGLSQNYTDKQEVLEAVSSNITQTHQTQDAWMVQWNNDENMTWDSYGFGLGGRENYSAARVAYNNGFASYLDAMDPTGTSPYSEKIRNFNSMELFGVGLPGLVCSDAFTAEDSKLKNKFTAAELETVYGLYQDYLESDAYTENGKVIYDVLTTFDATSDIAKDKNNSFGGDMFDYYNSYVDEISALYSEANKAANGGVVIIISVQKDDNGNSEMVFTVSPSSANPRNDS